MLRSKRINLKIMKTFDYDKFVGSSQNRDVQTNSTKVLESMHRDGFHEWEFILVSSPDKNGLMAIEDGQHRKDCAMRLGLPIYYFVLSKKLTTIDLIAMDTQRRRWSNHMVVDTLARDPKMPDYAELKNFYRTYGIPMGTCATLLAGEISNSGDTTDRLRSGSFHVTNVDRAENIAQAVLKMIDGGFANAKGVRVVESLIAISMAIEEGAKIDWDRLVDKVVKKQDLLKDLSTRVAVLKAMEDAYNWGIRGNKIPITIPATNMVKRLKKKV